MRLDSNAHDDLFTDASLGLGRIHWYLLRAATELRSLTTVTEQAEGSLLSTSKRTAFGKDVGNDEINWWIVKREANLAEFREQTALALTAVEGLKTASRQLREKSSPRSYAQLVSAYRNFAVGCSREIDTLHGYVEWLHRKDPLAPSILFTYRVWGSTKRGDRWLDLTADSVQAETSAVIGELMLTALGLAERSGLTYDRIAFWMEGEVWEANPEAAGPINIEHDELIARTARKSFSACAEYFEELRDSLRNIILDIDKYNEQRDVLNDDSFWRKFIEKALRKPIESRLWDFKETLPMWHTTGQARDRARVTFAEDLASFANASGGVVIVGITDKEPRQVVGIGNQRDVENRLKSSADAIARHLEYDRELVTLRPVPVVVEGVARTCLAVIVAEAAEPVGVRDIDGRYSYPLRRETGVARVSPLEIPTKLGRDGRHLKADNHRFLEQFAALVHQKSV